MEASQAVQDLLKRLTQETRPTVVTLLTDRLKNMKTQSGKAWSIPPTPLRVARSLSPHRQVNTPGHPCAYYCAGCGRRLHSSQELASHAWTGHPHAHLFGLWPRLTTVKVYKMGGAFDTLLTEELNDLVCNGWPEDDPISSTLANHLPREV